jgi:glyoxylase-like metal-dependent hydrolase (beta-lactamase superfamily II)
MKLHAIQTGSVRIKTAQVEGRGRGLRRRLAIFADRDWTEWLPTYAWVIDHPEGIIVVDTGQGTHLLDSGKSLHPYIRWETAFRIERDEEIGPQLRALGIGPRPVKRATLDAIRRLTVTRPTVYLPTHDPESAIRLAIRRLVEHPEAGGTVQSDTTRSIAGL